MNWNKVTFGALNSYILSLLSALKLSNMTDKDQSLGEEQKYNESFRTSAN